MEAYTSQDLSHLGLVSGMCDKLELVSEIDRFLGSKSEQQLVSTGVCVKAMILNGLGFSERRLYLMPDFFSDKPVAHLLGSGLSCSMLNDDRLGRCLDALYAYGISELFQHLSHHACKILGLATEKQFFHLDSTSFHVDGVYNSGAADVGDCLEVCMGYSRDHRPDLNQVMLNLVVEHSAGIPLQMEALSGNTSDKESFKALINKHISNLKADSSPVCWVADSALYTAKTLADISESQTWITRVPESIKEAQKLIATIRGDQMLPFSPMELSSYRYQRVCSQYAGVKQEWMVIFSEQAFQRELITLQKQYLSQSEKEAKAFEKLCKEVFTCTQDAQKALTAFEKKLTYCCLQNPQVVEIKGHKGSGRPKKGATLVTLGYQIQGLMACNIADYAKRYQTKGKFIIASNDIDNKFSPSEKLLGYKGQSKVERGFRFLKDKQFMASTMFVKKPERLEAILMIMTLSLLVYAALEREIRLALKDQQETIPNQLKKEVQNPTMRWVFALFKGIHCLNIHAQNKCILLNINYIHLKIIQLMGKHIQKYYKIE